MPSAPQTFKGIPPDKYALLTEKAKGAGIEMEGNSGTATKFGVEMQWEYSPETQELYRVKFNFDNKGVLC